MLLQSCPTLVFLKWHSLEAFVLDCTRTWQLVCAKRQVFPSHAGRICLASQQLISSAGRRLHDRWPTGCRPVWLESVIDPCGAERESFSSRQVSTSAPGSESSHRVYESLCPRLVLSVRLRCHTLGSRPNGPSQAFFTTRLAAEMKSFSRAQA